eukprot:COSAG06_NODE_666_length_13272_cov_10.674334_12_plen_59_part_00
MPLLFAAFDGTSVCGGFAPGGRAGAMMRHWSPSQMMGFRARKGAKLWKHDGLTRVFSK